MSDAPERVTHEWPGCGDVEYIRADLAVLKPRGNDGSHWATCYEAHGHHGCALRRIAELKAECALLRAWYGRIHEVTTGFIEALPSYKEEFNSHAVDALLILADLEKSHRTRIAKLEAALHQITEGKGRFSESPLVYAENCIEDMKQLALDALKGLS